MTGILKSRLHDTAGFQTGWTTGWMFVYTIQPVVQPVVKPVWQPVVSCIQTFNRLSNRLFNRLYEFNLFDSCNIQWSNRSWNAMTNVLGLLRKIKQNGDRGSAVLKTRRPRRSHHAVWKAGTRTGRISSRQQARIPTISKRRPVLWNRV